MQVFRMPPAISTLRNYLNPALEHTIITIEEETGRPFCWFVELEREIETGDLILTARHQDRPEAREFILASYEQFARGEWQDGFADRVHEALRSLVKLPCLEQRRAALSRLSRNSRGGNLLERQRRLYPDIFAKLRDTLG